MTFCFIFKAIVYINAQLIILNCNSLKIKRLIVF